MAVEIGAKVSGKVTGITNFGAFVDLGDGKTGLVHISEISDSYVKDIHDVLSMGDTVTVKVMSIKDGKIGLSIRRAEDKPHQEHRREEDHGEGRENHGGRSENHGHFQGGEHRSFQKPHQGFGGGSHGKGPEKEDFDDMMSGYLKESEDRLSSLRRNTEGKRGGRGGRRS